MLKLVQVVGFRVGSRSVRRGPVWTHQHPGVLTVVCVPPPTTCRVLQGKHHCCSASTRGALRFHSTRSTQEAPGPSERTFSETYSCVDPHREEEFVFPESSHPPEERGATTEEVQQQGRVEEDQKPPRGPGAGSRRRRKEEEEKAAEMQPGSRRGVSEENADPEFHDEGFPQARSMKKKKKKKKEGGEEYGSPDASVPVGDVPCPGCGAVMHCRAPEVPGYVPSEKYKRLLEEGGAAGATCQRCFLLTHHRRAPGVAAPTDEHARILSGIGPQRALVLLVVDLLDLPDSVVPDLARLLGGDKRVVVLGNKADLLPADSRGYLGRVRARLLRACVDAGVPVQDPRDVRLISARTGYGVEALISALQAAWGREGHAYLVGAANAGKSTLFNALLESDYCKTAASGAVHRATVSPWPGTTLNLLKFPIINPTPRRLQRRAERLRRAELQTDEDLEPEELRRIRSLRRRGDLIGRVGRTFCAPPSRRDEVGFDPDALSFGEDPRDDGRGPGEDPGPPPALSHNQIKDARWLYDTPGITKDQDILSLLTEKEVKLVVPTRAILPRTFILTPGMVLFLGGLARIDYLQGNEPCWFTVVASSRVPVHISGLEEADAVYRRHAGDTLLAVPMGGEERMKLFPPLVPRDLQLRGLGPDTAAADITLSSVGWVAVTPAAGERPLLRAHAPEGARLGLREPPLLPHVVTVRGPRIPKSPAYRTKKPQMLLGKGEMNA